MGMTYKRGAVWWVKYYRNGRPIRESSHSTQGIRRDQSAEAPRGRHRAWLADQPEAESDSVR